MAALHERLHFDTAHGQVLDESRRYVLLRADVLMGLFAELPPAPREQALRSFGRSVARHGADSVRAYAASAGRDALPALMESAAASLGWGRWTLDGRQAESARPQFTLQVENSPFAAASSGATAPVCHPIAGMLETLAAALWNAPAEAHETHCAAVDGGACTFVATPLDPPRFAFPPVTASR